MRSYLVSALAHTFTRPGFVFMVFITLTSILLTSVLFFWLETPQNPNLHDFLDALYFATTTFTTVGYGDIAPVTRPGKILAILMMFVGSLTYVTFMAIVSSSIIELDLARRSTKRQD